MAHESQRTFCELVKKRLPRFFTSATVLDVGSLDINGNNRDLFEGCDYLGLDLELGPNVDVVYVAHEFAAADESFDTVISTEAFEHDLYLAKTLHNIVRMLRPGGLFLFTCATTGRTPHGIKGSAEDDSPFTVKIPEWEDYYKNVTEEDVHAIIDMNKTFKEYQFGVLGTDIRFWGLKK